MPRFDSCFTFARVAYLWAIASLTVAPATGLNAQRVLTVFARDTSLEVVPSIAAGITTIRFVPKGSVKRELVVHRVPVGTMTDAVARAASGRPERWFEKGSYGGPGVPADSVPDAWATLDIRPGTYLLVAYEVDASGKPRGDRYLSREVVAVATTVLIPARFAVPDATIRVKDSRIEMQGTLRRGRRTLQVENAGVRPHDLVVGRLKPGKTIDDVRRWRGGREDAPFVYVGSLTPMSGEMTAQTRLSLIAGPHVVLSTTHHDGGPARDYQGGLLASFSVN